MKIFHYLLFTILAAGISIAASAQMQGPEQDQVSQIAEMLDLSDTQQQEIRDILGEYEPKLQDLENQAQKLQGDLQAIAGPDADESEIRSKAAELGDVSSKLTAESLIMDSRIQAVFTAEQRQRLEEIQMQQQQQMQQFQEQMQ